MVRTGGHRTHAIIFASTLVFGSAYAVRADAAPPADAFPQVVALITAVVWPVTVLLLVFVYRDTLRRLVTSLESRVAQGAAFSAFGISVGARGAPLPAATASSDATASVLFANRLGLGDNAEVLITIGEIATGDDESAVVGTGDALGLAVVQAKVLQIDGISTTSLVVRKDGESRKLLDRYPNVISIGGPETNRLTRLIMNSNYLTFEFRPGGVYDKQEHRLNVAEFSSDVMNGIDWGLLVVSSNPRNQAGTAVILAGYSGYGTNAAAIVFSKLDEYAELNRKGSLEALVRVKILNGTVESPELISVRTIPTVEATTF